MKRLLPTMLLTLLPFVSVSPANACIVRHMSYQEAFDATDSTVLGEIIEILPSSEGQLSRSFYYKVRIIRSERGVTKAGTLVDVELLLHLARKVKGSIMCPLQRGSGMEGEFKVGGRYRMLMKKEGDANELFWSEAAQAPQDKADPD